ncbi:brevican core protein-like [Neolamprologus brichardi]|uniref:brevican core protein-like n=1 Tax=Neolamprologus brichardi TaxID=32507 RepID=UPI0003EBE93A|nr:brevican core protein-like [Neolamprologus brichardi]
MLLRVIRHVQILPLLYAVCHLTLAFPTQTLRYTYDEVEQLHVSIPHSGPVVAPLSSSISIPCVVSLSPISNSTSATPVIPRVKWSVISGGVETQILVVRGHKVKVNEAYRDRAALLNYTSFPDDASLWLGDLRSSDSAHYRCEVQQGLEDASDLMELKVKGVVFHYRDALGRYAFTFHQAQRACEAIGARIATADQLLAAYYDGYEQCDAGWLADQSVRYPIQVPREGCYGDMDGQPGVRNYGTMDPDDLFDVYCYVDEINGEVFHDFIPQHLTFNEAQSYCRATGAELATTAQLYLAWSEGLDHCSPGWLSDGSVRYPIITPRERCGGALPGVKTLYQFSNQTGFPETSSLHDVYCFKENRNASTDSPMDYVGTESEDIEHNVVILTEKDQEIQLNQLAEQVEREAQSMLESLPYFAVTVTTESPVDTHPMLISDTTESPLHTTPTLHEPLDQTLSPTEMSYDSQRPTTLMSSTITETHNSAENTSFLPTDYNETYSSQNSSLTFQQSERPTFEPEMQNQTEPDTNTEVNTEPSGILNETKEVQQTTLSFNKSEPNYSETDSNRTKEDRLLEATTLTLKPMVEVELEETHGDPEQMFPPTEASKEEEEEEATLLTQLSQTTESTPEVLTPVWAPLDGSGDISEESKLDTSPVSFISTSDSSTSGFTTHPSPIASASSTHAKPQTVAPHLTASSQSPLSDKLGLDILSTASQLWESSISKQEGSANLEIEDTLSLENEDKMLPTSKSEDLQMSGASSVTTRSPDVSNTSHSSTSSPTALYLTSGYRMYLDTVTDTYEEASGHVPDTLRTTLQEDIKFAPTFEGEVALTLEEEANISVSLEKEIKISPTLALQKEANVSLNFEEENIVSPTLDFEENVSSAHESNAVPTAVFKEEEANITPSFEYEEKINASLTLKEEADVLPTTVLEKEPNLSSNISLQEKANTSSALEKEANVSPTFEYEEKANTSSTLEEEANVAPTFEYEEKANTSSAQVFEQANVAPSFEYEEKANMSSARVFEQPNVAPSFEYEEKANTSTHVYEQANVSTALFTEKEADVSSALEDSDFSQTVVLDEDEANVIPIRVFEEEDTVAPTLEDETNVSPTSQEKTDASEDFAIFPSSSQTSKWDLLTSTPQPQESHNEYSQKTSTAALTSSRGTKPTETTTITTTTTTAATTTTTHRSRHTWSPTTTTPKILIPPVGHALEDVDITFTQPPTLLIMPNERAAVGGAGKSSDACLLNPCLNGGTCTDRGGHVKCLCLPTYEGNFCQADRERCEPGWDKFHGFCYRHFSQRLSWEAAEQHCRMMGAHLVSIITPEEQAYINNNYKEYQWTGLNDKTIEDDFHWSDGNPLLYENWYRGQPDSYFLSGEDCVVMVWHDNGRWSDVPCNYHLSYTCKKGTSSCGPPPRLRNASIFGKARQNYETNAVVRYRCAEGFQQRFNPLIRCLSGGFWERPQILCLTEDGGLPSMTDNDFAAAEDDFEATKATLQYWDIRF